MGWRPLSTFRLVAGPREFKRALELAAHKHHKPGEGCKAV